MKLFLDASVLLAAAGSLHGSAHALFSCASAQGWTLVICPYALNEVLRNLPKLPPGATAEWLRLRPQVTAVDDVVSMDRPVIFAASKDRPILFSASAWAEMVADAGQGGFRGCAWRSVLRVDRAVAVRLP